MAIFATKNAKKRKGFASFASEFFANFALGKGGAGCFNAKNAERTQRPQRLCELFGLCVPQDLIAGAMRFSEMTVLAMDEILLRTEISRMRGRRRRGAGRPTGPARVRPRHARPSRMTPHDFTSEQDAAGGAQLVATAPLLQFYVSTRKIYQFLDSATKYGDFCHKERKETQRLCVLCVRILCELCVEKGVRDVLTQRTQREHKDRKGFASLVRPTRSDCRGDEIFGDDGSGHG